MKKGSKELIKYLTRNGYVFKRTGKGSHIIYSNGVNTIAVCSTDNPMLIRRMKGEIYAQ